MQWGHCALGIGQKHKNIRKGIEDENARAGIASHVVGQSRPDTGTFAAIGGAGF
jgi:hypothetical protein